MILLPVTLPELEPLAREWCRVKGYDPDVRSERRDPVTGVTAVGFFWHFMAEDLMEHQMRSDLLSSLPGAEQ